MRKRLTTSAVLTLNLLVSEATSIKIEQQDTWMQMKRRKRGRF